MQKLTDPEVGQIIPNHHPSPAVLDSGHEVIQLECWVWFLQNMALDINTEQLHCDVITP